MDILLLAAREERVEETEGKKTIWSVLMPEGSSSSRRNVMDWSEMHQPMQHALVYHEERMNWVGKHVFVLAGFVT